MGGAAIRTALVGTGLLLIVLLVPCRPCAAEEPAREDREAAERAFLEGRPQLLEGVLGTPAEDASLEEQWPFRVRDQWWRTRAPESLDENQPPHWRPGGGGDPYPVLTALVKDRHRRETQGHAGLPAESPLVLLSVAYDPRTHEALHYYLGENTRYWMNLAYEGYAEDEYSRRVQRNSQRLSERNGSLALWSLLVFVLGSIGLGLFLGRGAGSA